MSREKRFRLYVDESGDPGITAKSLANGRYLTLVGVAFEVRYHRDCFQPQLEQFKRAHLPYDPNDPPVLHKRDIIRKQKHFSVLKDRSAQQAFDTALLRLLAEAQFCVFSVVVDKGAIVGGYREQCPNLYHYAMAGLVARYSGWLKYVAHGKGDVLAEARYPKADRSLKAAFTDIYLNGTVNYPGPRPLKGTTIQQSITTKQIKLKAKERNIAGLQIADLLTHCCTVDILHAFCCIPPSLGPFERRLLPIVQQKYNRRVSQEDMINGYGRVFISTSRQS